MHGEAVGIAVTPTVAVAYGVVAVFLFALSRTTNAVAEPAMQVAHAVPAE
jgi:AGZA family xanthine/uracil permease-like MFS transporter